MAITQGNLVKWAVSGGFGYGKVVTIENDKANIELPTDGIVEKEIKGLTVISEEAYEDALSTLIKSLSFKSKKAKASDEAETEKGKQMAVELEKAKAELEKLTKEFEAFKTESGKKDEEMKKSKERYEKAESELAKIQLAQKTESRFNEIKGLNALAGIHKDEVEARKKLSAMSDEAYNSIVEMAKAFPKVTEQVQTTLPKVTEQTQTTETKVTEAKEEKEVTLETVTTTSAPNTLKTAMAKLISRKNDKTE